MVLFFTIDFLIKTIVFLIFIERNCVKNYLKYLIVLKILRHLVVINVEYLRRKTKVL